MINIDALIKQCMASTTDSSSRAVLQKVLLAAQKNPKQTPQISAANAALVEQAAQAAQRGDKQAASAAISSLLGTAEGAAIAKQIQTLIGK